MSDSKYLSRKFILAAAAFVIFTGLLLAGKIDQGGYVTLSMFALGAYFTANVAQKAATKETT